MIDCATRKVIGWAMADNYKTPLITAAIEMAARNVVLPDGAIFHSDRGSNYTSAEFAGVLDGLGIRQSVGRTGICYDNALAESFNAAVKVERVYRTAYPTRKRARKDIARYISPGPYRSRDTTPRQTANLPHIGYVRPLHTRLPARIRDPAMRP